MVFASFFFNKYVNNQVSITLDLIHDSFLIDYINTLPHEGHISSSHFNQLLIFENLLLLLLLLLYTL